jgi:NAD(P)-dependent dehydrogenase (short-subunit alcohol dehydrogenase family)
MPANSFDLTGRVALVTGGARGIGAAIASGLAQHGADVAVADWNLDGARQTAAALEADAGRRAAAFACDVSNEADVEQLVSAVLAQFGQIDILVNNAGITKRIALFDWTPRDWDEVVRINQLGTFLMARAVGRHMIQRRRGAIVNMSALGGGLVGLGRGNAVYCATKGAVVAMTREFAAEWAQYGVRVNCVAPGWIDTEMTAPLRANEAFLGRILDRVPLSRLGQPEDVAGPIVFLVSDAAAMITGHVLPIDGGASSIVSLSNESLIS